MLWIRWDLDEHLTDSEAAEEKYPLSVEF